VKNKDKKNIFFSTTRLRFDINKRFFWIFRCDKKKS
jgi:hypothetical protein